MKKRRYIIPLLVVVMVVFATVIAQNHVFQFYETNFGIEKEYYSMDEVVPFGADLVQTGSTAEGYSLRVDKAEVLTGDEFLERVGQTEETVSSLLGSSTQYEAQYESMRMCFLTVTLYNDNSDADGVDIADFTLAGENYDVYMDRGYTVLANDFLLNANKDDLSGETGSLGRTGIYLAPGKEAEIHIVYCFSRADISARRWNRLAEEPLWLQITYSPVEKNIILEME